MIKSYVERLHYGDAFILQSFIVLLIVHRNHNRNEPTPITMNDEEDDTRLGMFIPRAQPYDRCME